MVSRSGSVSLPMDAPDRPQAARHIAALIVWAWLVAACGLGVCTFILLSLSVPWFSAVSLLLGIGALVRALSLRRKISAVRLKSSRPLPDMPFGAANPSTIGARLPAFRDVSDWSPFLGVAAATSSVTAANAGSPQPSSLSLGPNAGKPLDEGTGDIPANARFTEHELRNLGLDQWEPDVYHPSADEGGPGIGLWIGVGLVVLIGVVVIRGRSARAKRAEIGSDTLTEESSPVVPPSAHDVSKIPQSSLGEGTSSALSDAPATLSAALATDGHAAAVPPTTSAAMPRTRRLGRFTPSPKLARFAVVPLLASFVLAYLAIRTAGDNTMSAAIPLALASFVALGVAFYLAPAS